MTSQDPIHDVINIDNLSRRFGRKQALSNVCLDLQPGVVLGLVGENGAGKTTLIKHLLGAYKAQQGSVRVFNHDPVREPVEVLGNVGYLSEERDLPDGMTIGQLMRYQAAFYPNWDDAFADELIQAFQLDVGQRIKRLSRGQRARTGLLVAVAHRPRLLVLDEPSSGLDPVVRRDILGTIIRTVAAEGRNVLFSSHLLDEVQRVADEVAMIHQGKILLRDNLDSVLAAHRRVTLRFPEPQPVAPTLPGATCWDGEQREWTTVCNGALESLKRAAIAAGAEIIDESAASLDEIFVARVNQ